MAGYDLKNEEEVKQFLENLAIEYRFGCYSEKKAEVCHLLGDYLEAIKKDFSKASKVYRTNCDDYGFARSCYKFGNYSFIGKGVKEDKESAFKYYKKGCEIGMPDSCLNAGLMCVSNSSLFKSSRNYTQGLELLERSCQGNNAFGCYYISGMFISGIKDAFEKDMVKAHKYALKACELGNMFACANLSQMYRKGDGVEKDEELAKKYKKKAIEMQEEIKNPLPTLTFQEGENKM